ncbi:MAG: hypothetical protein ABI579_00205 [Candidatus Sumerlaeota bacterium]
MKLWTLWISRFENPFVMYLNPWRVMKLRLILWFVLLLVLTYAALVVFEIIPYAISFPITIGVGIIAVGWIVTGVCKRRKEEELEELYITRITREEIVFGSLYWGIRIAMSLAIIFSLTVGCACFLIETSHAILSSFVALGTFLSFTLLSIKVARFWLMLPQQNILAIVAATAAWLFDVFVCLLAGLVLADIVYWRSLRHAGFLFVLVASFMLLFFIAMNLKVLHKWAVILYFREIEGATWRDWFYVSLRKKKSVTVGIHPKA